MTDLYRSKHGSFRFAESDSQTNLKRLAGKEHDFLNMMDMAASVAGQSFDIIEIPDYLPFAAFLPTALRYHNVHYERVVLSMHGTLSNVLRDNWSGSGVGDLSTLIEFENLLYRTADIRYGISRPYTQEWMDRTSLPAQMADVKGIFDLREFSLGTTFDGATAQPERPNISFIGRHEKCKGPDIFVDICSRLSRKSYSDISLIGPEVNIGGHRSTDYLNRMASLRDLALTYETLPRDKLLPRFETSRMIAMFPSRLDTFNLAALEAILSGCPTVISTACGIIDYLDNALPGLPYIKLDLRDIDGVFNALQDLLANHDAHRDALRDFLATHQPRSYGQSLDEIYAVAPSRDNAAAGQVQALFDEMVRMLDRTVKQATIDTLSANLNTNLNNMVKDFAGQVHAGALLNIFQLSNVQAGLEKDYETLIQQNGRLPAQAGSEMIQRLRPFIHSGDRVAAYRLLAAIERERGNDLLYATYWIRVMRLTGRQHPVELGNVVEILERNGLVKEAKAARLLYGGASSDEILAHLMSVKGSFMTPPPNDLEEVHDFRRIERPKASIIVSVYNGAGKIRNFLRGLGRLTAATKASVELVFVDSASVDDTRNVILQEVRRSQQEGWGLSTLYVRSRKRETIQRAWNRGITQARGEYLSFLGVDEMNTPDAFDIMMDYLDRNTAVDWVQGNTVVTEVDEAGAFVRDIMPYRRVFYSQDMHYLDCCYIGYVGAMYRRSIHDRLGYYDDSFRGAGDVEFKNRVLPWVRVKTLNRNLGVFLNYPEERATESPIAELEDLSAWYLHRSLGGVRYAYGERDVMDAIKLFHKTLSYRKSYMDLDCTDIELANNLAEYVRQKFPHEFGRISRYVPGVHGILTCYRELDEINKPLGRKGLPGIHERAGTVESLVFMMTTMMRMHRAIGSNVCYAFGNDNRSHQHHSIWASVQRRITLEPTLRLADLAGSQDLAEVVSSCGAANDDADFERAWATGKLDQLKRLFECKQIAVLLPTLGGQAPAAVAGFITNPGKHAVPDDPAFTMLVVGDADEAVRKAAGPRVFFSGSVKTVRPLYAVAKVVAFPFFGSGAAEAVGPFCQALLFGKPVLATSSVVAATQAILPGLDLSAVITCDDPVTFGRELAKLVGNADIRQAAAARIQPIRGALAHRSEVHILDGRPGHSTWNGGLSEWTADIGMINRSIRQMVDGEGGSADHGRNMLEAVFHEKPALRPVVAELLDALFVSRTAPILDTAQPVFKKMKRSPAELGLEPLLARFGVR
ncbi:glycosyltransferase [Azospirillum formosense]|uniref:glycosyltransferase n=1 Tax=Azospirillum formosense TaxID=861533 RepID=UPI00338E1CDB